MTPTLDEIAEAVRSDRRSRRVERVATALAVVGIFGALFFLWIDSHHEATVATVDRDSNAATALAFAEQLQAACEAGVLLGDICVKAAETVASPPPTPSPLVSIPPAIVVQEDVPESVLRDVAMDAVEAALPGLTTAATAELQTMVDAEVAECVASGACVGPVFPAEEVVAMVGDAVAAFCADGACQGPQGEPGPPGGGVTAEEAESIAIRVVVEYVTGRAIWCYPRPGITPSDPFGPCYMSSG